MASCQGCGAELTGRSHAIYCSGACRQRAYRHAKDAPVVARIEPQQPAGSVGIEQPQQPPGDAQVAAMMATYRAAAATSAKGSADYLAGLAAAQSKTWPR